MGGGREKPCLPSVYVITWTVLHTWLLVSANWKNANVGLVPTDCVFSIVFGYPPIRLSPGRLRTISSAQDFSTKNLQLILMLTSNSCDVLASNHFLFYTRPNHQLSRLPYFVQFIRQMLFGFVGFAIRSFFFFGFTHWEARTCSINPMLINYRKVFEYLSTHPKGAWDIKSLTDEYVWGLIFSKAATCLEKHRT